MSHDLNLGKIITTEQHKDAIHVAVAPVTAGKRLAPGTHFNLVNGMAVPAEAGDGIGVVDPFLTVFVAKGERFWGFLYPGSITSLRHDWTHPAFVDLAEADAATQFELGRRESEAWMRKWASEHLEHGESGYLEALRIGRTHLVGSNESIGDSIDNEWWNHWERITGEKADREQYFSCSC